MTEFLKRKAAAQFQQIYEEKEWKEEFFTVYSYWFIPNYKYLKNICNYWSEIL